MNKDQKKIVKIVSVVVLIFCLVMAMIGKGAIGDLFQKVDLYLLGMLFYWVNIWIILYSLTFFIKKRNQKISRRFLWTVLFIGVGLDLLISFGFGKDMIGISKLGQQLVFTNINIHDQLGLVQASIISVLTYFFGSFGASLIFIIIFVIGILRVVDIDKFFVSIGKKIFPTKEEKAKRAADKKAKVERKREAKEEKAERAEQEKQKKDKISFKEDQPKRMKRMDNFLGRRNSEGVDDVDVDERHKMLGKDLKTKSNRKGNLSDLSNENKLLGKDEGLKKKMTLDMEPKKITGRAASGTAQSRISPNGYHLPEVSLLDIQDEDEEKEELLRHEAEGKANLLIQALANYKLNVKVESILVGPTITKYELQPELGVKVNRFSSLGNDLAMAMAAKSVRIEAPIPGKSLIGIEIPNSATASVGLADILNSSANDWNNKLSVALGEGITGDPVFLDIATTPHLLVAGSTGSGKSVCINTMILSILFKATPEEVKLLLIDPKKVELTPYNDVPHLMAPVVTDPEEAAVSLNKLVREMEKRYELFAESGVKNIATYNRKVADTDDPELPYIVTVIDELADLMMVSSLEVENAIARLAQMARAAGIHLVIATQRPSTDVITGLIKSNIPSRIAFMVSSSIDSRTILDKTGAEKLLGRGDMLLSRSGSQSFERIQGSYVDDEEIQRVVEYIAEQVPTKSDEERFDEEFLDLAPDSGKDEEIDNGDTLIRDALQVGLNNGSISISLLQRKLSIGYNRAAKLIDELEDLGYIGPSEGSKGRKMLINDLSEVDDEQK